MKNFFSKPFLLALSIAVVLVVLILLLPRKSEEVTEIADSVELIEEVDVFSETLLEEAKADLDAPAIQRISVLEAQLKKAEGSDLESAYLDSIALFWQYFKKPEISAEYRWKSAEKSKNANAWFLAGDAYFSGFQTVAEAKKKRMLKRAIEAYNQIRLLDAENLSALNALGVVYVEGAQYLGEPPMKGIGMIREVLEKDPDNIDALVNLGYFAIKSGQYEKAVERFTRVLEIDPAHIEAYLYLTDIYVQNEEIDKAIKSLNTYKEYVQDDEKKRQIESYIKDLENNR